MTISLFLGDKTWLQNVDIIICGHIYPFSGNILKRQNIIEASLENKVKRVIALSIDKFAYCSIYALFFSLHLIPLQITEVKM